MQNVEIKAGGNTSCVSQIFLADGQDFDPQTSAMLQAFYSRSIKSIGERVEKGVNLEKLRESLRKFYIGYGHRSIGQCGNFVLFLEDVSIFAAKAIQHHPLYNGQETSTRYYDFTERPVILPIQVEGYEDYVRELYAKILTATTDALFRRAADNGQEIDGNMDRAIKARAFDIARAFLTAGFTTKLSWSTTFDQVQEQLGWLANSGVPELQTLAVSTMDMLHTAYPEAIADPITIFNDYSRDCGQLAFLDDTEKLSQSLFNGELHRQTPEAMFTHYSRMAPIEADEDALFLLAERRRHQSVPKAFSRYGTFTFSYNIDYGSFRDLHRHRNGLVFFPHYPQDAKMHPWYMMQLESLGVLDMDGIGGMTINQSIRHVYTDLLPKVDMALAEEYGHSTPNYHSARMYYVPMGSMVRAVMRYDLPQAIYVAELRSARTVHPTARLAAQNMARQLRVHLPHAVALHIDNEPDVGPVPARGKQTIFATDGVGAAAPI